MQLDPISSVSEYIQRVLDYRRAWFPAEPCEEIWYRGVKDNSHQLLPGAYWRSECDETSLSLTFRAAVPGLLPHQPADDWEWYYLMQHYGLPTRLLDWTENPLAALYFALDRADDKTTPAVWVLDPVALNKLSGDAVVFTPTDSGGQRPIDKWLTDSCFRNATPFTFILPSNVKLRDNRLPLAIFPKRHNPRIIAQRGTFTVHGVEETPINRLAVKRLDGGDGCARIDIAPYAIGRMREELWGVEITKTLIYPEPQSLAEDLKRIYGVAP